MASTHTTDWETTDSRCIRSRSIHRASCVRRIWLIVSSVVRLRAPLMRCACVAHILWKNACVGIRVARITLPREAALASDIKSSSNHHQHQNQQARARFGATKARAPRDGFFSVSCAVPAVPRHASDKGDWQLLVKAWLGSICDARRRLVLCVTEKEVRRYDVSLFHVVDSCAAAWPVNRMPCGAGTHTIELARSVKGIPFLHTTCSKNATPCKGTWRSWFYQMQHFQKNVAGMQAETRMVLDGRFKDVKQIGTEDVGGSD